MHVEVMAFGSKSRGFGGRSKSSFGSKRKSSGFGSKKSGGFGSKSKSGGFGSKKSSGFGSKKSGGFGGRSRSSSRSSSFSDKKSSGFGGKKSGGFGGKKSGGFGSKKSKSGGFGGKKSGGFGSKKSGGFGSKKSGGFGSKKKGGGFGSKKEGGGTTVVQSTVVLTIPDLKPTQTFGKRTGTSAIGRRQTASKSAKEEAPTMAFRVAPKSSTTDRVPRFRVKLADTAAAWSITSQPKRIPDLTPSAFVQRRAARTLAITPSSIRRARNTLRKSHADNEVSTSQIAHGADQTLLRALFQEDESVAMSSMSSSVGLHPSKQTPSISKPVPVGAEPTPLPINLTDLEETPSSKVLSPDGALGLPANTEVYPPYSELMKLTLPEARSVRNFQLKHDSGHAIAFLEPVSLVRENRWLPLDELIDFRDGEIVVYPQGDFPPRGEELNHPARITVALPIELLETYGGEHLRSTLISECEAAGYQFFDFNVSTAEWMFDVPYCG